MMNSKSNRSYKIVYLVSILALTFLVGNAIGQSANNAKPEDRTEKIASKFMKRDMKYRVILPAGYSKKKSKSFPVVYILHGMGGSYQNFGDITDEFYGSYEFIVVIPDGARGFWTDSHTIPSDKYESHLMLEIVPQIEKDFRVIADRQNRIVFGTSMGGYGAIKLGVKYPEKFSLVGSLAGAVGVSKVTEAQFGPVGKVFDSIFGPLNSETRKANDIQLMIDKMSTKQLKALPMIFQSVGTEDKLVELGNVIFFKILKDKKIRHEYRELPGAHDPKYFQDQIRQFLNVAWWHLVDQNVNSVFAAAQRKGGAAGVAEYRRLKREDAPMRFNEFSLNTLGYGFLRKGKTKDAIEIFKLNVELFPKAFNPYDSLGEAYLKDGNKELALLNYKKSVELNPGNTGGINAIKSIEGDQE